MNSTQLIWVTNMYKILMFIIAIFSTTEDKGVINYGKSNLSFRERTVIGYVQHNQSTGMNNVIIGKVIE